MKPDSKPTFQLCKIRCPCSRAQTEVYRIDKCHCLLYFNESLCSKLCKEIGGTLKATQCGGRKLADLQTNQRHTLCWQGIKTNCTWMPLCFVCLDRKARLTQKANLAYCLERHIHTCTRPLLLCGIELNILQGGGRTVCHCSHRFFF